MELSYREIIDKYGECVFSPTGNSMLPLIREGINQVHLVKITKPIKKYDIVLFERINHQFVLHRVIKKNNNQFSLLGDNQLKAELNVKEEQMIAIMVGFYENNKYFSLSKPRFILYSRFIVWFRWIRILKHLLVRIFKRGTK